MSENGNHRRLRNDLKVKPISLRISDKLKRMSMESFFNAISNTPLYRRLSCIIETARV